MSFVLGERPTSAPTPTRPQNFDPTLLVQSIKMMNTQDAIDQNPESFLKIKRLSESNSSNNLGYEIVAKKKISNKIIRPAQTVNIRDVLTRKKIKYEGHTKDQNQPAKLKISEKNADLLNNGSKPCDKSSDATDRKETSEDSNAMEIIYEPELDIYETISSPKHYAKPPPPIKKIANVYNILSDKDLSALKVGRLILSSVLNKPEITTVDSISRFFFDVWLSQYGSSLIKADDISIDLITNFEVSYRINLIFIFID